MKRTISLGFFSVFALFFACAYAQVTTRPVFIQKGYAGEVTIIFNPAEGNKGMAAATSCYAHTGVLTSESATNSDWKHVVSDWRAANTPQLTKVGDNWELTISPDIYTYYNCPASEEIRALCFVFHDGVGGSAEGKAADGSDIIVELTEPGLAVMLQGSLPNFSKIGDQGTLTCYANAEADLVLTLNGTTVASGHGTELSYDYTINAAGNYAFVFTATVGDETATATANTCVPTAPRRANRPAGVLNGIYYDANDDTKVTLCTYAASKTEPAQHVYVVGDFNDWVISEDYQLAQANDSAYFWITLSGLEPKKEYAMQYVVVRADGETKYISDLFSEKLLHPDDQYEPSQVIPDLKPYPAQGDGYVTVIQTGKDDFQWSDATLNFQRPDKNNLVIYEIWVYDHTPDRSIAGLMNRLDYIEHLGVNAVELMPVNEFDGNNNWGYSPNHYFALDKAYGTPEQLKTFIDECHKRGIAVILDMVFNHATGLNPMNKLYPYGTDLAQNPWFNVNAPHPDNVYEDWNHAFGPTKSMFTRVLQYWLREYKIDGYRMDLSHGLCGDGDNNSLPHIRDYYNHGVKAVSEDAYFILEHWGTKMGTDRPQLVSEGMLCWNNTCTPYEQLAMGWMRDGDNLSSANQDGYVSYSENHDEERVFFKAKQWGDGEMQTDLSVRAARVPATLAFVTLLNGPSMFYHFAELGYDNSKFQNAITAWGKDGYQAYGSTATPYIDEEVKMQPKMRPEDASFFLRGPRMDAYQKTAQAIQLRTRLMPEVFAGNPTATQLGSGKEVRFVQWGSDVYVVANFSATTAQSVTLPSGTWFDYYAGGTSATGTITLQPGELKIYTGRVVALPEVPDHYDFPGGWEDIESESTVASQKVLYNGEIYIIRNGVWYDLMGRARR